MLDNFPGFSAVATGVHCQRARQPYPGCPQEIPPRSDRAGQQIAPLSRRPRQPRRRSMLHLYPACSSRSPLSPACSTTTVPRTPPSRTSRLLPSPTTCIGSSGGKPRRNSAKSARSAGIYKPFRLPACTPGSIFFHCLVDAHLAAKRPLPGLNQFPTFHLQSSTCFSASG